MSDSFSTPVAIIAGVNSGTGSSLARKFAKQYAVIAIARRPSSYEQVVREIETAGGEALGVSADLCDPSSIAEAFQTMKTKWRVGDGRPVAIAVFNATTKVVKPFLDFSLEEYKRVSWDPNQAAFLFAQYAIPLLQKSVGQGYHPTFVFSGATASVKGYAHSAAFCTSKFALRALSQSLAREFGPQGIHVAHCLLDGPIDTPRRKEQFGIDTQDARISPDAIADAYWYLHTQPRTAFTQELDMRTFVEKW